MTNLNCILSESSIPAMDDSEKLLEIHPLWDGEAKTGTGVGAPFGTGASDERVLG